ncbi:hypothetical protein [Nocardia africana]|uniref:Uncharacterized protein n=1 Tax=Nocardia africana TaxID=134964 RepID=A0ABW6NVR3_9NOCA
MIGQAAEQNQQVGERRPGREFVVALQGGGHDGGPDARVELRGEGAHVVSGSAGNHQQRRQRGAQVTGVKSVGGQQSCGPVRPELLRDQASASGEVGAGPGRGGRWGFEPEPVESEQLGIDGAQIAASEPVRGSRPLGVAASRGWDPLRMRMCGESVAQMVERAALVLVQDDPCVR